MPDLAPSPTGSIPDAVRALQRGMLSADPAVATAGMAADVVLVSPLTDRFTFRGPVAVGAVLGDAAAVMKELAYGEVLVSGRRAVLRATATVRGVPIEEVILVTLDDRELIEELVILGRPLPALAAMLRDLAPRVARKTSGPLVAFGAARLSGALLKGATIADAAAARTVADRGDGDPRP